MEDRSALFNQLKEFSQRKLKKVETKVVTGTGEQLVEKRGAKGLQVLSGSGANDASKGQEAAEPPRKLDLQVGYIAPGLLIGSNDVAHDKSSLDNYGVTHILNLDSDVENKFEDDYNYKNISMQDKPDYEIEKIIEDCLDFIDDGRHYGNVLVHCSGTIGLSRSTTICIAYLMSREKQKFDEAFNNVKEARSFVKPNEGFIKQLKEYEVKLRGAQQVKDSGIDDPFALRKKQEIEQEKAMVAGAASVKNRMKMFGATLDTNASANRSKSVSPSPAKTASQPASSAQPQTGSSKWSTSQSPSSNDASNKSISKSMTPEPRKSWQKPASDTNAPNIKPGGPPPPPPPMPSGLLDNDKSLKPLNRSSNVSSSQAASSLPPPPPPPQPQAGKVFADAKKSIESNIDSGGDKQKMVFGRVKPPPMKIRSGISIERQDSTTSNDSNTGQTKSTSTQSKSSLQLPLKKQYTADSDGESSTGSSNPRAPSPSAALRQAKQQVSVAKYGDNKSTTSDHKSSDKSQRKQSVTGQLNRSSTKKLLNLIKTKTKTDLTLSDGDENDEIEALLGALESESIEKIDWDELGLDEDEVRDIIEQGGEPQSASASSSSSSSSSSDEEVEEEEEEVETSTQHYVIRTKY